MCFDDAPWEQSEAIRTPGIHILFQEDGFVAIGQFIVKHRRRNRGEICDPNSWGVQCDLQNEV
jgi:hypothetical protein